ncbi:hypothetical protein SO802_008986 [Lithocarpus litseifolius]|uniref:Aminotransferase-like plant mobile domain-containing protein n=1 Tax=Lithocarpus litseifolius TaxID=425828 RepID=A0AAW2DB71_9ROSI
MDKSGDRVHLMWVQQLEDLRNPRRYSWGSACLAWLYRELCRASDKKASQIGGCLLLVQYWAWARFPYLCPAVERGPPVGAYGPPVRGPLSLKWVWVPNKKNRTAHIFRDRYREKIASMLPNQVVWQPYEAELESLPPWCVAGRVVWMATVPLVCFHLVEKHTPDRVVRQFGMIQEIPRAIDTDTVLHAIDLRGKVGVDWVRKHAVHIVEWGNRLQRRCEAVLGDMPPQHEYFDWFRRVTRRFIDIPGAKLILLIEGYVRLLRRHPVGTEDHKDIIDVLTAVHEIGRVQPPIPEAPNEEAATPAAAPNQRPSTTESPSTSTTPAGSHSRPPVATPRVVPTPDPSPSTPHPSFSPTIPSPTPHPSPSPTIPSPTPHPSPSPTIPSPTPHPSPSPTIPSPIPSPTSHPSPLPTIPSPIPSPTILPPTPHPCPGSDIHPPTPRSFLELLPIPSFDLGIDPTPPDMHQEPPSQSTSTGPSSDIDPPHVQAEQAVGLPAVAEGRPKRISKAPPCGTGGHKHGHKAGPEAFDEGHARPSPYYTRQCKVQKRNPYVTGTSVVAIKYNDGILMAADMGGSYGYTLRYKSVERLKPVGKHSLLGASREISDFQEILRYLDELILYDNMWDDGNSLGPKEVHSYLTRVMYNRRNKFNPLWNSLILGGVKNGQIYLGMVSMIGVNFEDNHVATGFGNHLARPILRDEWHDNLSFEDGVKLLEKCMRVLLYRDTTAVNKLQPLDVMKKKPRKKILRKILMS